MLLSGGLLLWILMVAESDVCHDCADRMHSAGRYAALIGIPMKLGYSRELETNNESRRIEFSVGTGFQIVRRFCGLFQSLPCRSNKPGVSFVGWPSTNVTSPLTMM